MPGLSEGIGTHEIHSVHMAMSFLSAAGPPHLDLGKNYETRIYNINLKSTTTFRKCKLLLQIHTNNEEEG